VHRLDKDTSGIVVAAKNDRAMRSLAKQFQKRCVKKVYVALVSGEVEFDNGVVEASITRHKTDRKKMEVTYDEEGKNARTVYHVVKRFKGFTFLRLELETGRTHQARVHMKHIGHPVLGDGTYGKKGNFKRQLLHAEMLGFTHPDTGKYMEFNSPIPDDIMEVIEKGEL
jgi:23S rRNA pseudouridine1911/1915/1917 synthase